MHNAFWRHALFVRGQSFSVKTFDSLRNGCQVIGEGAGNDFRGPFVQALPLPSRVSFSRARFFLVPSPSKRLLRRLKDELNLVSAPDIERAHRVGKSSRRPASAQNSASRPRTIVCRLRDWKERETILKCARRIKPDNIFVKEDLSPATLEKRESQRPKMEAAKRAGKIAYFVLEKLVIRDGPNVENS